MSGLDSEQVRHAILTALAKGYRQVRVRSGEDRFSAVLPAVLVPEADADEEPAEVAPSPAQSLEQSVKSPTVGYFRSIEPAVKVGDLVAEGDKVGEVVALGLANDVTATGAGEVADVCVVDGDAVEYGQRILVLRN